MRNTITHPWIPISQPSVRRAPDIGVQVKSNYQELGSTRSTFKGKSSDSKSKTLFTVPQLYTTQKTVEYSPCCGHRPEPQTTGPPQSKASGHLSHLLSTLPAPPTLKYPLTINAQYTHYYSGLLSHMPGNFYSVFKIKWIAIFIIRE